jgi:probable HAF family extracellular repeat protein
MGRQALAQEASVKTHAALLFVALILITFAESARSTSAEKKDAPTQYSYTDLSLAGGSCLGLSTGRGINSSGHIVGSLSGPQFGEHAYLYRHGTLTDLNTLLDPSDVSYVTLLVATAISDNGLITAQGRDSRMPSADGWGFLIADGKVKNLGSLGGDAAYPNAVNSDGEVVGQALLNDFISYRAFVYRDGTMTNLNTVIEPSHPLPPSIYLREAFGITERGSIAVFAYDSQAGVSHCYLLKPINHRGHETGSDLFP